MNEEQVFILGHSVRVYISSRGSSLFACPSSHLSLPSKKCDAEGWDSMLTQEERANENVWLVRIVDLNSLCKGALMAPESSPAHMIPHWGLRPEVIMSGPGLALCIFRRLWVIRDLSRSPSLARTCISQLLQVQELEASICDRLWTIAIGWAILPRKFGDISSPLSPKQPTTDGYGAIKLGPLASRWNKSVKHFTLQSPHSMDQGRNLPETTSMTSPFLCLSCFPYSLTSFFPGHPSINCVHLKLSHILLPGKWA